ncbi:hypothetical protein [Viridibacillus arvi]|uniref:hypothetical protein n=1 Tax=Viridibacillus arvi TaxID=263475 RepID=UPI003D03487F
MEKLINEYKQTLKDTKILLKKTEIQLNKAFEDNDEVLFEQLSEDMTVIRSWISNLTASIEVMKKGRYIQRGIERRAAYEREIPVDNLILQRNSDRLQQLPFDAEIDEEEEEVKRLLAKQVSKVLTAKEREVFNLAANKFSQREISKLVNIPRTTVQSILDRCKSKIIAEGWMIV